ncbi:MAG: hypothetical protein P8Q97_14345 [Myxococcota bacterium]|nr:hypothetical protein [Myxococcota bacterium]
MKGETFSANEPRRLWTRRGVLMGGVSGFAGFFLIRSGAGASAAEVGAPTLPKATQEALDTSPLVYISPLLADGKESRCHGEVWFFVDGGSVVIVTATDRWKANAVRQGRDQARLWVGDFGQVGRSGDRYRKAPSFVADAEIISDRAVFDRLLESFAKRYPDGWAKWKPRFEKGFADGSRVMIRYSPASKTV